ncbi:unnamed protein product [Boreogadus saida]
MKSFDFETLKKFQFQVVALDSGSPPLRSNVTVNVFILDQNDNPPVILHPISSNGSAEGVEEVPRNVPAGHLVTKVRAYDADIGYNGWLLFSLQEVSDHSLFGLDRYTGRIRTLRSFTETDEAQHKLVILVKDNGNVSLSATATVVVKLVEPKEAISASDVKSAATDIGDSGVTFYLIITLASVSTLFLISIIVLIAMQCSKTTDVSSKYLPETNYDGTLCHSIQYRSGEKRYMLVGPRMSIGSTIVPGSNGNTLVVPDRRSTSAESGEIKVKGGVDFEKAVVYKIDVQASDRGTPPLSAECRVIIKIQDLNDNPPTIEVTSLSNTVPEDTKPGTGISLISVSDKDSGVNGKIILSLTKDLPFELKPTYKDNVYSVVTKGLLDRETVSHYDITITATDCGEPPLLTSKTLRVQIADVNDNSPYFLKNPVELYLVENNAVLASIFSVSASDRDLNENAAITYHILRQGGPKDMASFLNVNSDNGQISALKTFDFESLKTFTFKIVASDSGTPALSSNVTVNVFLLDQNDNPPVILHPVSSNGSAEGVEEVPRNVPVGHLVTKVRAYDADIGYNGWLLFSLQEVSDHSLFGLDRYTGRIRTLRSFTETDEAQHKLVILVKDNGNVSLSATATVVVQLVEPIEAISASDVKSAATDIGDSGVTFYLMITLASVSTLFLISIIVLIAMQCSKTTDVSSKYLPETNYDGTLCHSIQYRSGEKRYMLVGPRMSIGSTIVPGSNGNTLVVPDRRSTSTEVLDVNDHSPSFSEKEARLEVSESSQPGLRIQLQTARDSDVGDPRHAKKSQVQIGWVEGARRREQKKILEACNGEDPQVAGIGEDEGEVAGIGEDEGEVEASRRRRRVEGGPLLEGLEGLDGGTPREGKVEGGPLLEGVEGGTPLEVKAEGGPLLEGHLVTKVRAYDADIGYNGWLLFSLQDVSDQSLFGLDRYTGQIRTLRSFTETDEAQHKLVILVIDNGNVSLSATATVIVKLVEPKEAISASDVKSVSKADDESNVTFYLMITLGSVSALFIASIIMLVVMQCSKPRELSAAKYLQETNYDGTLCHSIQYRSGEKRYMLVGPRMSIGSTIVPGSNGNTLVVPDRRGTSG